MQHLQSNVEDINTARSYDVECMSRHYDCFYDEVGLDRFLVTVGPSIDRLILMWIIKTCSSTSSQYRTHGRLLADNLGGVNFNDFVKEILLKISFFEKRTLLIETNVHLFESQQVVTNDQNIHCRSI